MTTPAYVAEKYGQQVEDAAEWFKTVDWNYGDQLDPAMLQVSLSLSLSLSLCLSISLSLSLSLSVSLCGQEQEAIKRPGPEDSEEARSHVVHYAGKHYRMLSKEKLERFMRTPWMFVGLHLPVKLPLEVLYMS